MICIDPTATSISIAHLYPQEMNLYGDRGNVLALVRRCQWRNIPVTLTEIGMGEALDPTAYDIYFMGGGQDAQQEWIGDDLMALKAEPLRQAARGGAVFLTICGGYQLLGSHYQPHQGNKVPGLGILNLHTEAGHTRWIGNVVVEHPEYGTIVGFENHSGNTYLGDGVSPLGKVIMGSGNNGTDGEEGVWQDHVIGTYLHGPLLPKNPRVADAILEKALSRKAGEPVELPPLDDGLELRAQAEAVALCQQEVADSKSSRWQKFWNNLRAYR